MKGRKPMPFQLIDNGKQHLSKDEREGRKDNQIASKRQLRVPKGMSELGAKEWKRIVKLYREAEENSGFSFIDDLDESLLASYCEAYAVWKKAETEYQNQPLVDIAEDGKVYENPYITIMERQVKLMSKLAEQLCLSPVGRARVGLARTKGKTEDVDPMEALLRGDL